MRIIDRLLKYLDYKKITAYSFERTNQVANGYLKKQEKGKGSVGSDILERIHRNYPDLNLLWLVSGKGEMTEGPGKEMENKNMLQEDKQYYTKDEIIKSLSERILLLEKSIADKEKIIEMLETRIARKKSK